MQRFRPGNYCRLKRAQATAVPHAEFIISKFTSYYGLKLILRKWGHEFEVGCFFNNPLSQNWERVRVRVQKFYNQGVFSATPLHSPHPNLLPKGEKELIGTAVGSGRFNSDHS